MCLRRIFYTFFLLQSTVFSFGQIRVLSGTTVVISPGTSLSVETLVSDTLKVDAGALVYNNGRIFLSPSVIITEEPAFPISGTGYEEFADIYSAPLTGINPGGLGFILSTASAPDSFRIKRYHSPLSNGGAYSIARSYQITAQSNAGLSGSATFNYDVSELNTFDPANLFLYHSWDGGSSWNALNGSAFNYYVQSDSSSLDSLSLFSLFPFDLKIDSLNATSFYYGDSIRIYYSLNGLLNPGNVLKFEFSDATGDFSVPFTLDSINIAGGQGVITRVIPVALVPGVQYRIRLKTTDLVLVSADNGADISIMDSLSTIIDKGSQNEKYEVFPNPSDGNVFVKGKEITRVTITDELGQTVAEKRSSGTSVLQLELENLPPAVYVIAIETSGQIFYKRFIKI
jgi:hypothetical protein